MKRMNKGNRFSVWHMGITLAISAAILAACGGGAASPTATAGSATPRSTASPRATSVTSIPTPTAEATSVSYVIGNLPIKASDPWRYFIGKEEPPATWKDRQFDDSSWPIGQGGFGFGDNDDVTILSDMQKNSYSSLYIRRIFNVTDPNDVDLLNLLMDYDDGFVAYLNGTEIARSNVQGGTPPHNALASSDHEASRGDTNPQNVQSFNVTKSKNLLVAGNNVLAIQGHNATLSSSDFSLIASLTTEATLPAVSSILIKPGDVWSYFKGTVEAPSGWRDVNFNDSSWSTGPAGFGFGDGDDATLLSDMAGSYSTVYIRHAFTLPDPRTITRLTLHMDYDDGFVAYINGTEVARSNVSGDIPTFNTLADSDHEASKGDSNPLPVRSFEIRLSSFKYILLAGPNILTIQGHNVALSSTDFSLNPTLSLEYR